jgi:hypothetical protein
MGSFFHNNIQILYQQEEDARFTAVKDERIKEGGDQKQGGRYASAVSSNGPKNIAPDSLATS